MPEQRRRNLSKAIYEIGKFVFSGIVIGFILKFKDISGKDLLLIAFCGTMLTVILFTIAYLVDAEE
ncbi:MAG TPA: hypothetical protein DCO77_02810 [Nitrospiraceae bacterium]|nr:hypothetical protein [Nitrospiraceae bacterium]